MMTLLGVIGYMCFAYAIYVWAVKLAPNEQEIVGVTSLEKERAREAELIDLTRYIESRSSDVEDVRRAA
ncbi:MAG: hypothetical protein KF784_07050 [Fimbriimonadaceae bacterium]|nr:hypothetical protein [Fimbriimonadaceae bacterium]